MMKSSNPSLMSNTFSGFGVVEERNEMTLSGTINKTLILLLLVALPAFWTWKMTMTSPAAAQSLMTVGLIGGFILSLVTIFKKNWSAVTAPIYAVMEGLFLGTLSAIFEASYPGIVIQAISLSFATLFVMLLVYRMGWIRATESFKVGIVAATGGIALVYFVAIILSFFGINVSFINGASWMSILFSVFVVAIAALNFILDFDFIEQGARGGVPKYMEWYSAFALMVTLIWLYLEILRLLAKINERR